MSGLSKAETLRLEALEGIIKAGKDAFLEVGKALAEIKESRLYRDDFPSFKAYLDARWGISRGHAYRLIDAAEVKAELSPIGDKITNEAQIREVAKVPKSKREEVVKKATAAAGGEAPTARQIADTAKAVVDPEDETEWEPVDADDWVEEDAESDPAADRAREQIPGLVRKLRFLLGNLGAGGKFDSYLDQISEFAG